MINNIFRNSYFIKMACSFLIVLLTPLIIMGIVFYYSFMDLIDNEINRSSSELLQQITDSIDVRFEELNRFGLQIQTDSFLPLLKNPELTYDTTMAVRHLGSLSMSNNFINEYYFYLQDSETIAFSSGTMRKSNFFPLLDFLNVNNEESFLKKITETDKPILAGPVTISRLLAAPGAKYYFYLIPLSVNSIKPNGAMIYFINESSIQRIIAGENANGEGQVYIYDKEGRLIANYTDGLAAPAGNDSIDIIKQSGITKEIYIGNKSYISSTSNSQQTGWFIVNVISKEAITHKVDMIKNKALLFFVLALLVGLLAVYYLSKSNYRPVMELIHAVSKYSKSPVHKMNEMQSVKFTLDHMGQTIDALNEKIQTSLPSIKKDILTDLLKGGYKSLEDFNEISSVVGIKLNGDVISVAVLYIPELESGNSRNLIDFLECVPSQEISVYGTAIPAENHIALILSTDNCNISKVDEIVNEMKNSVLEKYGFNMTIGISCWTKEIKEAGINYLQALTAVDYRFVKGKNTIISFEDIKPQCGNSVYFHDNHLKTLAHSIIQGNFETIDSTIDSLFNEIREVKTPLFIAKSLCYNITNLIGDAISKLAKEYKLDESAFPDIFSLSEFETMEELAVYLKETCKKIYIHHINTVPVEDKNLISSLLEYVNKNYTNSSFSLYQLSDYFQMSLSNLSHYFKTMTNENITEYVRRLRIEKAKELIHTDDSSNLREIAEKVGYDNVATFIRNFKQYTGITPGAYREML